MYKPTKNQEKHESQLGGVIANFGRERFAEATAKAGDFLQSPVQWIRTNQPIRKALLLEGLDILRPNVEVEHEHKIQSWKRR